MIAGIDLGTTHSLIGVVDAGFPILLADESGSRLVPSAVYFPADGTEPVVGLPALRRQPIEPGRTVTSVKRLMGRRTRVGPAKLSPEEVSAFIVRRLKSLAERVMEREISRAVITVPAYFNDRQRTATRRAGELAGFTVERLLNEPTAAALAFGLDKLHEHSRIAVYDLGGGTFDISILELRAGVFEVLSTAGDTRLGGDDIDQALVQRLVGSLPSAPDPIALARVRAAAIAAKHALSTADAHTVSLPFIDGQSNLEFPLTRADLETVARPILERTLTPCHRALADSGLNPADLDRVLLVGGATRMPLVRELVASLFQREPDISQHPDETVALGATIQAGVLSGSLKNVILLDVTPLSLGLETFGGLMNVIIPRNTTIPCRAGELFTNAVAGQHDMLVRILQGERELARDNWELGSIQIEFPPGPKASARVGVQFEIDQNGILRVLTRDLATQTDRILEIADAAVDVDDSRVEEMIQASIDFAFDDMRERAWTEARQKADDLLPVVEQALRDRPDLVDPAELPVIIEAMAAVRTELEGGHAARLKSAVAALDAATEALAARMVEEAIDASLRRRGLV